MEKMNNDITINPEEIRNLPDGSITDPETIRQIALHSIKFYDNSLNDKIDKRFAFAGLYPHVMQSVDITNKGVYIPGSCTGVKCFCGKDAKHKLEETIFDDDPHPFRHNLTSYVCCEHFQLIMGSYAIEMCKFNKHDTSKQQDL
jgi:hypothetical protein